MKTKHLIIFAIALFVVIGGIITTIAVLNTPKMVAARSLKNLSEDFMERREVKPIINILKKGSAQFTLNSIKEDNEELFKNNSISGKVYFSKNSLMLSDIAIKLNNEKISGDAYISDNAIYVTEENILGGSYGLKLSDLADQLSNSIFSPDRDTNYSIDEDLFDKIISTLDNTSDKEKITDEVKALIKKTLLDLTDIIVDNAEFSSEKTSIRINGSKTKVRLITITVDADSMESIIKEAYDYLASAEHITEFIEKYDIAITAIINEFYGNYCRSFSDIYDDWLEDLEDDIDDICDDLEDNFETVTLNIATRRASAKLLKLELKIDSETVLSLDCGNKGIKKTNTVALEFLDYKASYKINENSKKKTDVSISIEAYEDYDITLVIDKEHKTYTATFKESYYYGSTDKYTVKGNITTKGDKTTLTVDKITNKYVSSYGYESEYVTKLGCEVILDTKDKMPSPIKKYNSLSDITEKNIDKWIDKLSEFDF